MCVKKIQITFVSNGYFVSTMIIFTNNPQGLCTISDKPIYNMFAGDVRFAKSAVPALYQHG